MAFEWVTTTALGGVDQHFRVGIALQTCPAISFACMRFPSRDNIPSESTIEILTNHFILQGLGNPTAWIISPTRNEETALGYDAAIQRAKLAVIQYKRVDSLNSDNSLSVSINTDQHETLLTNFGPLRSPYVFYCFSVYRNYAEIDADFMRIGAPQFFRSSTFFSAHDVPIGSSRVRLFRDGTLKPYRRGQSYLDPIRYCPGPVFIRAFRACILGEAGSYILEAERDSDSLVGSGASGLNFLHWPIF